MRVLEELSKLYDADVAIKFKRLRFQLYELEKQVLIKLQNNSNNIEVKASDTVRIRPVGENNL